jgi:alkaline phosphatase D
MGTTRRRPGRQLSRREILNAAAGSLAAGALVEISALGADKPTAAAPVAAAPIHQATGVKVGEVTDTTALLWARLTRSPSRVVDGPRITGKAKEPLPAGVTPEMLEGACPGMAGRLRVRFGTEESLANAKSTDWAKVGGDSDFAHQFPLADLKPATTYFYAIDSAPDGAGGAAGGAAHASLTGRFRTAPASSAAAAITFCVVTCQMYADLDDPAGFHMYPMIAKLDPHFVVFTGDNVYYDSEAPQATSPALARYHWERMYSLPRHVELLRGVASYWEKDDHDTLNNDCVPGGKMGELTFAEGQKIFRQQCPIGEKIYRTFRWGKDVQIWLTDGRDFRSKRKGADGPDKTIWGAEQKAWFKKTVAESDATWKVLISPTPIVGPDRGNKNDNHANTGYQTEGDEIRAFIAKQKNMFTVCGDRHWQYHSVHPQSGVREFSVGPASDKHASGSPGLDKEYHKFHRVKGGFLAITVKPGDGGNAATVHVTQRDVHGDIVHEWKA